MSCFWGHFSILLHGQINTSEVDEGESHNTVKWKVKTCLNLSVWIPFSHLNAMREPLWQETDYILTNFWLTFDSLSHSLAKQTSIPIHLATFPFTLIPFVPLFFTTLLPCHSHCPTTKVPRCLEISSTDLLQQKGDPHEIRFTNHCLKPLWAHGPRDKDSHELYSALAGLTGCLFWDWQARMFLRWKIACGQPTESLPFLSYYPKKFRHKGISPLSW